MSYDVWDRQTIITHPNHDIEDDVPRYTTEFTYDEEDSLLSVEDENDKTVTFEYDAVGRLTDTYNQKNEHEQYVRNSRGFVTQVINGRGKSRYYVYTDRGDLYYYRHYLGGISYQGELYSYDGNANTTSHSYYQWGFATGGESKFYEYDVANRLIEVDYDTGSMTNVTFDYDAADRMIEMVDGTGTTTWDYWDDGQVKEMASPQGTVLYDYYATTGRLQYLTEVISGGTNIVTTYTYDDAGRTETIDKFGETTTFEYDEASRPEKMTYDTGAYALYTYDGRSRIKAVEHKNSSNTLLRKETNTYDPASRITSRYEGPASGGVTTTFGYDDAGQLTSESSSGYSASYTYDANGNRATRTVNSVMETYTVDDSDKLTSVTWSNGLVNYSKEYAYHYSGRPTSITLKTNGVTTATRTFTWDKESRITALTDGTTSASYVYNGFTARTSKTVGGTSTTYKRAGASAVSPVVANTTGGTTTNHLPGISSKTGGTSTFSHSGIKNGVLQSNSSQTNTGTKRYDAFGNVLATTGSWTTQFSYGAPFGYQSDSEFGYQLLGHRFYDPSTGRFLTRDPIKDGRNWYAYCEGNPVSFGDPNGNQAILASPQTVPLLTPKTGILPRIGHAIQRWFPKNRGFKDGYPKEEKLNPGDVIQRYGSDKGRYVSPEGLTESQVGLEPQGLAPRLFRVLQEISVQGGPARPVPEWGAEGGGWQYLLPQSISELVSSGFLAPKSGVLFQNMMDALDEGQRSEALRERIRQDIERFNRMA